MVDERRQAPAAWAMEDASGRPTLKGQSDAVIDDAGLSVGMTHVSFLDAEGLRAADYRIEIDLWPKGRLVLTDLGRRFETFSGALRQARNQARVAGLLAHAPDLPEVFDGVLLSAGQGHPVELQVYSTQLTIVPPDSDPWLVPLGALSDLFVDEEPPAVVLVTAAERIVIGQLGRRRDAFHAVVTAKRDAQAQMLARYTGRGGFADGIGIPRDRLAGFDSLLERCSSADRRDGAKKILASVSGGEPRIGFVQLLDPDAESLQAGSALPENWASFLLVPAGPQTVLEILAGPAAATYVFEGDIEAVNRDLQQLHFRRAGLALTEAQAEITPDNPLRLALRKLAPLKRLRAATRARLVHNEGWAAALAKALAAG